MAFQFISESTSTAIDGTEFVKTEHREDTWKSNNKNTYTEVPVSMTKPPVNDLNSFVRNIFIDESEEDVTLWSDEGGTGSDATISDLPHDQADVKGFQSREQLENRESDWSDALPGDITIDTNSTENESTDCYMEQRVDEFDDSEVGSYQNSERTVKSFDSSPSSVKSHLVMNTDSVINSEISLNSRPENVSWTETGHTTNMIDNETLTQMSMDNYMSGECESSEEVSEWTDDGATSGRTNENEIIYMDAGTKIEKIIKNLDIIESDVELPGRAHLLITTLRELTKELQSIINDRAQKIDELEMQCESQEILIKSHQEENEFILERIDHAMKELENTISEQHKKIDQLDKHSLSQDIIVENHINEKAKLLQRICELENLLNQSNNDKDLLCEKLVSYDKRFTLNKKDKEHLQDKVVRLEVALNRQTTDKELLLERICNLEVELDDLMKIHNEEKDLLLERINYLEVTLNDAEATYNSKKSCVLSHDLEKELLTATSNNCNSKEVTRVSYDPKIAYRHTIGMETTSHKGSNIYAYANTEAAINVIHNMLHKDKLTKLI